MKEEEEAKQGFIIKDRRRFGEGAEGECAARSEAGV